MDRTLIITLEDKTVMYRIKDSINLRVYGKVKNNDLRKTGLFRANSRTTIPVIAQNI